MRPFPDPARALEVRTDAGGRDGQIKGGKTTLVNALLGEEVADTGLLELTFGLADDPTAADGPVPDRVRRGVVAAPAASGVTTVEDTGRVAPARHHVVATRDDPSGLLSDRIAETVRPGYFWRDVLLRPQEVVSYVPYVGPGPREPKPSAEGGTRDDRHRQRPPEVRGPLRDPAPLPDVP